MNPSPRNVAIFGATGSIGRSTLEVIAALGGELRPIALSAHGNLELLAAQAKRFAPRWVVATDRERGASFDWSGLPRETELLLGPEGIEQVSRAKEVDIVVAAVVGSAGLRGAWGALESGKTLALANKETLVLGGALVTELAARHGATILPVDSEHSAIFQALSAGRREEVRRVILTASGGPFRDFPAERLKNVSPAEALVHPTWEMGRKITVDSATMMNKALEIIEARWLFDLAPEQIDVVIHPQSVVHSLVEYIDGSVLAQLSPPDMKLPIQYALTWPRRLPSPALRWDLSRQQNLEFRPPDLERFPALLLGHEVAKAGGTAGAVLNAANEAAVGRFLSGELKFLEIAASCRDVLRQHPFEPRPTLETLLSLDSWARKEIAAWKS